MMTVEIEKHPKGVMIAGGISAKRIGKLSLIMGQWISAHINKH